MTEGFSANDALERFVALTKLAKLKQGRANQSGEPSDLALVAEAAEARERATSYTAECIAQEIYKRQPALFSPEIQARFSAVGRIVDKHIQPGPQTLEQSRALIERAEKFASSSPYHEGNDETNDNQGIANWLNATGGSESLPKYLAARELGERRMRPPTIPFTAQDARELTDELGYLYQQIRTRLRTIDRLFSDESNDRIGWQFQSNIASASHQLESKPADPTLARIDAEARERKERTGRAISDDPFFESSSSPPPVVASTAPSRQTSSHRRDTMSPDENASSGSRRRFEEYSRSSGSSSTNYGDTSAPRKRARGGVPEARTAITDVRNENDEGTLAFDPATFGSDGIVPQESRHSPGLSTANARPGEPDNQRTFRDREGTRSAGLDD
ncbi:hypothetical protein ACWGS9_33650 [Bradyrhizobium sp. Arg314]